MVSCKRNLADWQKFHAFSRGMKESIAIPPSHTVGHASLRQLYEDHLAAGHLRADPAQMVALDRLQAFADQLHGYRPPSSGLWARLKTRPKPGFAAGFYLYGEVGRGKSMVMDLLFESVRVARKRRVHFHQFMLEIHARLHKLQHERADDVLPRLARDIAEETWLLCFDEFHVGNIADAMILGRLFTALFAAGVKIFTTSNWRPDDLYKNGLQRDRFLPFIDLLKQRMIVHEMAGVTDHRYEQIRNLDTYFHPLGLETTRKLQGLFLQLTDDARPEPITLPVQGRDLRITHAAKGVGFFNFDELCGTALGAADYLAIAECLHTVILDGVPILSAERRNETARLTNLIDALYEAKIKLFMGADAPPEQLAPTGELAFTFQRTVSRLMEMQGEEYRLKPHLGG